MRAFFLPILALGMAVSFSARAQDEQKFEGLNCAVTPPAGWETTITFERDLPKGLMTIFFISPDGMSRGFIVVDGTSVQAEPLNEEYVADFEKVALENGGGSLVRGKFVEIGGIKAYERLAEMQVHGRPASIFGRVFRMNGKTYSIQALTFNGLADRDKAIMKFLDSFRFLTPPKPMA